MNAKKCLVLFLTICLCFSLLTLGIAAEDAATASTGVFGTNWSVGEFVSLCIGVGLLLIAIVICIIKRKKLMETLRSYRSDMKKITWYSWKNVVRGTVFVLIGVVAIAIVVGLLDFVFFQLQDLLIKMG